MSIKIVCSNCGFSRDVSASSLPQKRVKATCPKCNHVFEFDPTSTARQEATDSCNQQPAPETKEDHVSLKRGLDAKANKLLFASFLLLILLAVGVRLWADSRYRAVPYPNLLAASTEGVAVSCGQTVYVYATDGTFLRHYPLPAGVQPTQLFWDKGKLCLADMKSKSILELDEYGIKEKKLRGISISAQFKATREPGTGHLFVSDGANHRILIFDETGKYLRSFGKEGTNPGEFKFPNEIYFDEKGQLLVANTKRPAIEIYLPDGQFQGTLVEPAGDRTYRYPTDFVLTPDRLLLLENDGFLNRGKIRSYDRKGIKVAEVGIGDAKVIGDIVTVGERLLMSDCLDRQLVSFSLANLHPLGPFSNDFANKCAEWGRDAMLFKTMSYGALIALLVFCAPVIFFYVRMKRDESRDISQIDISTLTGKATSAESNVATSDLFLGTPVNTKLLRYSFISFGVGILSLILALTYAKLGSKPSFALISVFIFGQLTFFFGLIFLVRAGGISNWKRKQTESAFKKIIHDDMLALLPDEHVERVALAQNSQSAQDIVLLIFTDKRLMLYYVSWNRVSKIEQYPFEAISKVTPPSGGMFKLVQSMQVSVIIEGKSQELTYYYQKTDFLQLLCNEFSKRIGKASRLPYARLCLTCRKPLYGEYCATCATRQAPNLQAMWLSFFFPGLGQLRNGELQKGLLFIVFTVISLLVGYLGIKGWLFEGADLTLKQKFNVSVMIVLAPIWYVVNIVDAYRSSIRGRKPQ